MKSRKVTQFICEFCGKRGLSASHMAKHEQHCTMNANRICRVCGILGHEQPKIEAMLETLPDPKDYMSYGEWRPIQEDGESISRAMEVCLPELRKAANHCPACIMAALRQKGVPVPCAGGFDFTKEMQAIWQDINEAKDYEAEMASLYQ